MEKERKNCQIYFKGNRDETLMKKSELRKLVVKYKEIQIKLKKNKNEKLKKNLKVIEHRYFHETGKNLDFNINKN